MNNGCPCSLISRWPLSFLATRRQARLLYILCLLATFATMLLLAYTTSNRNSAVKLSKHIVVGSELVQKVGSVFEAKSKSSNISDRYKVNIYKPSSSDKLQTVVTQRSINNTDFQAPIFYNCSQMNTKSELLSMKVPQYDSKFKNPCWYEDLPYTDVYSNNKFAEYYYKAKTTFVELTEIWQKSFHQEKYPRRLRCLPYFFIAGQPKCGSTDLYQKLSSHPDVVSPPIKESHWWGKNRYGWRSNYTTSLSLSNYIDLYDKDALYIDHVHDPDTDENDEDYHQIITGDASVSTLWDNDEWWRLKENCGLTEPKYTNADYVHHFLPKAKIIVILRDPVDRLWSDYLYFQKSSKSPDDFHQNVVNSITYHEICVSTETLHACIFNRTLANLSRVRLRIGMYYAYIEKWLNIFPREQFLILRLEDYAVNNRNVMKRVFRFLNLRDLTRAEQDYILGQPVANVRRKGDRKYGSMENETRRILEEFYEPFNKRLALLLNDNRYMWKDKLRTKAPRDSNSNESRVKRSEGKPSHKRLLGALKKRQKNCNS